MTPSSRLQFPSSPMCDDCGYDLTHTPDSGLCTECGLPIAESVGPHARRRGVDWQDSGRLSGDLISTTWSVLTSPAQFYRMVRLRDDHGRTAQFARIQFAVIALVAALWVTMLFYIANLKFSGGPPAFAQLMMLAAAVSAVVVLAWIVRNSVATAAVGMWSYRQGMPPPAAIHRVRDFETAFLWVLCVYNGGLITSFVLFDDLWSELSLQFSQTFGQILAPLLLFWGSVAIILLWMLRCVRIAKSVQYGNY